jgi:tetratricopeptide (TPR) repeat protein
MRTFLLVVIASALSLRVNSQDFYISMVRNIKGGEPVSGLNIKSDPPVIVKSIYKGSGLYEITLKAGKPGQRITIRLNPPDYIPVEGDFSFNIPMEGAPPQEFIVRLRSEREWLQNERAKYQSPKTTGSGALRATQASPRAEFGRGFTLDELVAVSRSLLDTSNSNTELTEANRLFVAGKIEEAQAILSKTPARKQFTIDSLGKELAQRKWKIGQQMRILLGDVHFRLNDLDSALFYYRLANSSNEKDLLTAFKIYSIHLIRQSEQEIREFFPELMQIPLRTASDSIRSSLILLGSKAFFQGFSVLDIDTALQTIERIKSTDLELQNEALGNLAIGYVTIGETSRAVSLFQEIQARFSPRTNANVYGFLHSLYGSKGLYEAADSVSNILITRLQMADSLDEDSKFSLLEALFEQELRNYGQNPMDGMREHLTNRLESIFQTYVRNPNLSNEASILEAFEAYEFLCLRNLMGTKDSAKYEAFFVGKIRTLLQSRKKYDRSTVLAMFFQNLSGYYCVHNRQKAFEKAFFQFVSYGTKTATKGSPRLFSIATLFSSTYFKPCLGDQRYLQPVWTNLESRSWADEKDVRVHPVLQGALLQLLNNFDKHRILQTFRLYHDALPDRSNEPNLWRNYVSFVGWAFDLFFATNTLESLPVLLPEVDKQLRRRSERRPFDSTAAYEQVVFGLKYCLRYAIVKGDIKHASDILDSAVRTALASYRQNKQTRYSLFYTVSLSLPYIVRQGFESDTALFTKLAPLFSMAISALSQDTLAQTLALARSTLWLNVKTLRINFLHTLAHRYRNVDSTLSFQRQTIAIIEDSLERNPDGFRRKFNVAKLFNLASEYAFLSKGLMLQRETKEAWIAARKGFEVDSTIDAVLLAWGTCLVEQGDTTRALTVLSQMSKNQVDDNGNPIRLLSYIQKHWSSLYPIVPKERCEAVLHGLKRKGTLNNWND